MKKFIIKEEEANLKLQIWIKRNFPYISYGMLNQLLRKKLISGAKSTNEILKIGQVISIQENLIKEVEKKTTNTSEIKEMIIFENENYIVLNKPNKLAMQGTENSLASITNGFIVHRLDKTTTGIALIAKNPTYANIFSEKFKNNEIKKTYLALCCKNVKKIPEKGIWKNFIDEKEAITEYKIIKETEEKALIELKPQTGRKHQLRIHCAQNRLPILGDLEYGDYSARRIFLHSYKLSFELDGEKKEYKTHAPFLI